ncbi:unnamed protein product [Dibothriocephalus latus]|uniref:Uncharacterized protein n=1 Tax=Dibothriocephalus latus TaxID=60516 RepID=A0A3P7LXR5_DIBLA|nr:unnamed protein product [Dibothriocephalus latus]
MCKLSHLEMRKLSVDALVLLIKQAIMLPRKMTFWDDEVSVRPTLFAPRSAPFWRTAKTSLLALSLALFTR